MQRLGPPRTSPTSSGAISSSGTPDRWRPGDYYQIALATTGLSGITVNWDQTRSGTGPAAFKVMLSVNGGTSFSEVRTYTVPSNSWNSSNYSTSSNFAASLGASASGLSSVIVRFQNAEAANSSTGGTSRIDNITVSGDAVPGPGAIALLGLAGLATLRRR